MITLTQEEQRITVREIQPEVKELMLKMLNEDREKWDGRIIDLYRKASDMVVCTKEAMGRLKERPEQEH